MSRRTLRISCAAAALALTTAACGGGESGGSGSGGDTFEFRVADQYSPEHSIGKASIQPFMKAVEQASDGRISFEYFPSDGLVAAEDVPEAITSGTADLGNLVYIGNLNPLLYVVQLPGLFSDDQTAMASQAFSEFVANNEPTQQSFEELGIVPLFCFTVTNYQLEFAEPGVDSLEKVKGRQIRSAGVVLPYAVEALGANPSDIAINEAYDAFNRGVIDSISLSVPSVKAYAFIEIIESAITNANLGGYPVCYGMGQEQFDSMPQDLQQIVREEGEKIVTDAPTALMAEVESDLQNWEEQGIALFEIDESQRNAALEGVEQRWLQDLESNDVQGGAEAVEQWKSILDETLQ